MKCSQLLQLSFKGCFFFGFNCHKLALKMYMKDPQKIVEITVLLVCPWNNPDKKAHIEPTHNDIDNTGTVLVPPHLLETCFDIALFSRGKGYLNFFFIPRKVVADRVHTQATIKNYCVAVKYRCEELTFLTSIMSLLDALNKRWEIPL